MTTTKTKARDWLKLSQDWEQSALSQRDFCHAEGIGYSCFTSQRSKLSVQGLTRVCHRPPKCQKSAQGMHFVAVSLPAQSPSLEQVKEVDFIEIKLPHGIVMRIPAC